MVPADQRLGLVDGAGGQFHNGLVIDLELLLHQCRTQVVGQAHAGLRGLLQRGGEETKAVAPGTLGHIQGLVGVLQQVLDFSRIRRVHGDADAGRDKHLFGAKLKDLAQRAQHFLQDAF